MVGTSISCQWHVARQRITDPMDFERLDSIYFTAEAVHRNEEGQIWTGMHRNWLLDRSIVDESMLLSSCSTVLH